MKEYRINVEQTFDVPAGATNLTITHEWGSVLVDNVAVSGTYDFTADSIGVHKFAWIDATIPQTDFYSFITKVISPSEFFIDNEDLEDFDEDFDEVERLIRHIIQNYTGQRFGPYVDKSMELNGDGGDSIYLPVRLTSLSGVVNNFGDDITDLCEISPNDPTFIQRSPRFTGGHIYEVKRDIMWNSFELFNERNAFTITGNWGWEYVPSEVVEAAKLLIIQGIDGDDIQDMRSRGVFRTELGDFKLFLNQDQWGSTGNNRADTLLSAYVQFGIGLA